MKLCLIISGEEEYAREYVLILKVLGYDSLIARNVTRAWGYLTKPLSAILVIDRPSRFNEDPLLFLRNYVVHAVPVIVAQGERLSAVAQHCPDYIVHWDCAATQLREAIESIEMRAQEQELAAAGEGAYDLAAE